MTLQLQREPGVRTNELESGVLDVRLPAPRVILGRSALDRLPSFVGDVGVLLVTSPRALAENGDRLRSLLGDRLAIYSGIEPGSQLDPVNDAHQLGHEARVGAVVGLGGGSTMVAAKLLAASLAVGVSPGELLSQRFPIDVRLPLVCVPTLLGGAAFTPDANARTGRSRLKASADCLIPDCLLLDPDVTASDGRTFALSAFVAISHSVEAQISRNSNMVSRALGSAALEHQLRFADTIAAGDAGHEPRERLLEADWGAILAVRSSGTSLLHALCQELGVASGAAHSRLHATLLPFVLEYNQAELAASEVPLDVDDTLKRLAALRLGLNLERGLSALGVRREDLTTAATAAVERPSSAANPRRADLSEVVTLLEEAW